MKILLKILFAISTLISLILFALFAISFVAWINGGGNVLLPGLGLVIAMSLIVVVLFIISVMSFSVTFLLYKFAFKTLPEIL